MPRNITIPAQTYTEEVQSIEEYPVDRLVRVVVGRIGDDGRWIVPQRFQTLEIQGDLFDQLIGDGEGWAEPDKPVGTYRNEDLWYFIDFLRAQ
jgi:hypothetical protein